MKHTAKKILCTLLVMVMCLTVAPLSGFVDFGITASALADSGSCGENVTYTYDSSTGELVISGTGAMTNYISPYSGPGSPFYYSDIKSIVIEDGVTSIGNWAFVNCRSLASIIIPDSVTSIGNFVFLDCRSLASIIIPDSVTSIGVGAFEYCTSLENVTIPDSVTSIGGYAFDCCENLASVTIPDSVTTIGDSAFRCCENLASVTIPDSVTSIGDEAFCCCESLQSITIPDSVTSIGDEAFRGCTSLESVTIGDSVTSIGDDAFRHCASLTDVYYGGTEEQWNSIVGNECLTGATIHSHTHSYTSTVTKAASCTEAGVRTYTCSCGDSYTEAIPATGHDFDGTKCKNCSYDKADDCSCNCHKSGFMGFIWKIILFFNNLF